MLVALRALCCCAEVDSDDDQDAPAPRPQQPTPVGGGGGLFDGLFAANPMQQGQGQQDMEMGALSSTRGGSGSKKKKATRRRTKTSTRIHILNRVDRLAPGSGSGSGGGLVDAQGAPELAAGVLEGLRKAREVAGLDGADSVFNQAVKGSVHLQNVRRLGATQIICSAPLFSSPLFWPSLSSAVASCCSSTYEALYDVGRLT